ncbi:MAG: hypothetical protein AB1630_01320 [bacterium]
MKKSLQEIGLIVIINNHFNKQKTLEYKTPKGIIGFLGTTRGIIFGLLLRHFIPSLIKLPGDVYYISSLPFTISTHSVFWISISSFVLSILFSIYPALFASKISLSDALREE